MRVEVDVLVEGSLEVTLCCSVGILVRSKAKGAGLYGSCGVGCKE